MLLTKHKVMLDSGQFYKKFTPYYKNASQKKVKAVDESDLDNYCEQKVEVSSEYDNDELNSLYENNQQLVIKGGRS